MFTHPQVQLNHERRNLANVLHQEARRVWLMGRMDRVNGYEPALKWRDDPVYRAGYEGERRKEVTRIAA